jgi:hypothetical protein
MVREFKKQSDASEETAPENSEASAEAKSRAQRRRRVKAAEERPPLPDETQSAPEPVSRPKPESEPELGSNASIPSELKQELDEEEKEFRAIRRDLDGVKGASAAGIVIIAVSKTPGKNEFFRTHPTFRPIVPMVNIEQGMDKHYFAVAPDMVSALAGIGITVSDHALYLTVTSEGALCIVPVRQASDDGEQNEYDRTKEIGLLRGRDVWLRLYTDMKNKCYKVFEAPVDRFSDPLLPELKHSKIFKLGFRDKGRLLDTTEHSLFLKWAARDRS